MGERSDSVAVTKKNPTTEERTSERELVVRRTVNGPAHLVFEAWTKAELFQRWWVPKSFGLTLLALGASIGWCFVTGIRRWRSSARTAK
jgi:hypothetical protein